MVWLAVAAGISRALLEGGRAAAAQHDVEAVAERPFGLGDVEVEFRDQALARAGIGDAVVDRVERQQRVAGEIHLGDQPLREAAAEQREMDVRRAARHCGGCARDRRRA